MTIRRVAVALAFALLGLVLLPSAGHAWTPATHVYLGESVLANLIQLPAWIANLLRVYPYDFLYGNIAADTSVAKKYAPLGRHCHAWHVGQEIYELADSGALRAFGLGYLSHLAADTVAHNFFVPHQLVVASSAIGLGHSYWESRFETHLGEQNARTAMDLIRLDHSSSDAHLDRILSPTIFSVRTGRRLFRGMVGITETQSWQRAFRVVAQNSRWDLTEDDVERHVAVAFELVMDVLGVSGGAARRLDPSGEASLSLAKRLRRKLGRNGLRTEPGRLTEVADEHFGLPGYQLPHWESSAGPRPWQDRRRRTENGGRGGRGGRGAQ